MVVNEKDSQITVSGNIAAVLLSLLLMLWGAAPECSAADMNSGKGLLPSPLENRADTHQMAQAFTFDDLFKEDGSGSDPPQHVFRQTSYWM